MINLGIPVLSWKNHSDINSSYFIHTSRITKESINKRGLFALLLFTQIPSLVILLSRRLKKSPSQIAFQLASGLEVSRFTACLRSLLSVWSWCRQAVTSGLKYKYRDSHQFANCSYLELIQRRGQR